MPVETLDLEAEATAYASQWGRTRNERAVVVGVPSGADHAVLVFTVEAARCLCGMAPEVAARLLRMAADELEDRGRDGRA